MKNCEKHISRVLISCFYFWDICSQHEIMIQIQHSQFYVSAKAQFDGKRLNCGVTCKYMYSRKTRNLQHLQRLSGQQITHQINVKIFSMIFRTMNFDLVKETPKCLKIHD